MRNSLTLRLTLGLLGVTALLLGDEALKPPVQATSTEHLDFAPGGLIRVNGSYDDLYIEGWDQPQVEMSVTKFMPFNYEPGHPERAVQHLEAVGVATLRRSASELDISINLPHRSVPLPLARKTTGSVRLECHLRVPRTSRLAIRHGTGMVSITNVSGDIEARCHRGDIMLWLPSAGRYDIDAKNKLGKVSSDFPGASKSRFLVGQKFASAGSAPAQRLYLRMGFGGITLKPILPESEAKSEARAQ